MSETKGHDDLCDACEQSPGPLCTSCAVREEERRIRAEEQAKALEFCCEDSGVEALTADRDAARAEMAELRGALDVAVGLLSEVGITCTIDSLIADRVERQDTDAATAEHWSNQTEERA